jgi:hypothetical protein
MTRLKTISKRSSRFSSARVGGDTLHKLRHQFLRFWTGSRNGDESIAELNAKHGVLVSWADSHGRSCGSCGYPRNILICRWSCVPRERLQLPLLAGGWSSLPGWRGDHGARDCSESSDLSRRVRVAFRMRPTWRTSSSMSLRGLVTTVRFCPSDRIGSDPGNPGVPRSCGAGACLMTGV